MPQRIPTSRTQRRIDSRSSSDKPNRRRSAGRGAVGRGRALLEQFVHAALLILAFFFRGLFDLHLVEIDLNLFVEAAGHDSGERDDQTNHHNLNQHKRHRTPVNLHGGDGMHQFLGDAVGVFLHRRHTAQVEQRETKRRVHERSLHVDAKQHTEPDQVDAQLLCHRAQQRHHDERQFEEVEEERQHEDQDVHHDQETHLAARQAGQQMLNPLRTIDPLEHQTEDGGTNQDEHHEAGQFHGGIERLLEQAEAEAAACDCHHQGADGAHRAPFGRCGDAEEDSTEHQENEQQRRDQNESHSLSHAGKQAPARQLVDHGRNKRDQHTNAHCYDNRFIERHGEWRLPLPPGQDGAVVLGKDNRGGRRDDGQSQQRGQAGLAVVFADGAGFRWQRWHPGRLDEGNADHVQRVHAGQNEAGNERTLVHVAYAATELVRQNDQHQRRRDDLRQRAGGGNDTTRQAPVVAVTQHDRQRDQPH
jgi:hypothetical protein